MYSPEMLLVLARAYCKATGISFTTLGRRVTGNDKFFTWIASGGDSKYRNVATASDWFDEHWPTNVPWPRSIKRRTRHRRSS